jgi:hypothetical protein
MTQAFLDSYGGQTTEALIELADSYRKDSLVLAFEHAIRTKRTLDPITREELFVIAIEALEREVNNGGYHQFFINSSVEFSPFVAEALREISCPITAAITEEAIAVLGLSKSAVADDIEREANDRYDEVCETLNDLASRYYESEEPIADYLFDWIKQHTSAIRVG